MGDDANKTKRLWEMLSPALEWADDITLIEAMARTMGKLVKSGGAMASDIVDLEVRFMRMCACVGVSVWVWVLLAHRCSSPRMCVH